MSREIEVVSKALAKMGGAYIDDWLQESAHWNGFDVYDKCAELVGDTRLHLDIGCSFGVLLSRLHKSCPDSILLGVEKSSAMINLALDFLGAEGVNDPVAYLPSIKEYLVPVTVSSDNFAFKREFEPDRNFLEGLDLLRPGSVTVLQDDVRSAKVLKFILADRQLESASFTFPGTSSTAIIEHPYQYVEDVDSISRSTIKQRIAEIMHGTRMAMAAFVSEHVKTGGILVLADRLQKIPGTKFSDYTSASLGKDSKYWEHGKVYVCDDVSQVSTRIEWSAGAKRGALPAALIICSMLRNEAKYEK